MSDVVAGTQLRSEIPPGLARSEVTGLEYDSRRVQPGFVFFAFPGAKVDGRVFASQAADKGAIATVSELPAPDGWTAPWIQVAHGRHALALAARTFYGNLDEKLSLIGITGTNGKTTTAFLLDSILRQAGKTTAMVGTIEYRMGSKTLPAPNTTPESLDLERLFSELNGIGGTHVIMEVSSHALALGRVFGLQFHTAVFTNFTRDHLDYHGTMEAYFRAKRLLFDGTRYPAPSVAVVNAGDPFSTVLAMVAGGAGAHVESYGFGPQALWRAEELRLTPAGAEFLLVSPYGQARVKSRLAGEVNVLNLLAALAAAHARGVAFDALIASIPTLRPVPGRFQPVVAGQPFTVIVDYAHTDDALRNLTKLARELVGRPDRGAIRKVTSILNDENLAVIARADTLQTGRVITLFGCGGDRDRTKRPKMGLAAGEGSDFVVVTSDNPRSEEPVAIIHEILPGVLRTGVSYAVEPDRAKAIRLALGEARAGDVVLLAGKGHEKEQILSGRTIHFDDAEVSLGALRELGYGGGQ